MQFIDGNMIRNTDCETWDVSATSTANLLSGVLQKIKAAWCMMANARMSHVHPCTASIWIKCRTGVL